MASKKSNKQTKENELVFNANPCSLFSESIKLCKTNLNFSSLEDKITKILVTSPEAGDGKSFISSNIAISYAMEGNKVLLIDCDMRKGRLHKIFKLPNHKNLGYSNLILNYKNMRGKEASFDDYKEYILPTKIENLFVLPCGPIPPNPVELLGSDNNEKLIKMLGKFADIIILDCPPVGGLSDALLQTKNSDYNILVVSEGKTKEESLANAINQFEKASAKINGVILNNDTTRKSTRYNYKDGYYYKNYY